MDGNASRGRFVTAAEELPDALEKKGLGVVYNDDLAGKRNVRNPSKKMGDDRNQLRLAGRTGTASEWLQYPFRGWPYRHRHTTAEEDCRHHETNARTTAQRSQHYVRPDLLIGD